MRKDADFQGKNHRFSELHLMSKHFFALNYIDIRGTVVDSINSIFGVKMQKIDKKMREKGKMT